MINKKYLIKKIITFAIMMVVVFTSSTTQIVYANHDCLSNAQKTNYQNSTDPLTKQALSTLGMAGFERQCWKDMAKEFKKTFKCLDDVTEDRVKVLAVQRRGETMKAEIETYLEGENGRCVKRAEEKAEENKKASDELLKAAAKKKKENEAAKSEFEPLEPLPGIKGAGSGGRVKLQDYLAGMFKLGIGIATVLAVLMLVVSGMQYIGGASSPNARSEAHKRIISAITGLLIAIGSFLLLSTIDTELVGTKLEIKTVDTGASSKQGVVEGIDGIEKEPEDPEDKTDPSNSSGNDDENNSPVLNTTNGTIDTSGKVSGTDIELHITPIDKEPTIVGDNPDGVKLIRDPANGDCILKTGGKMIRLKKDRVNCGRIVNGTYRFPDINGSFSIDNPSGGGDGISSSGGNGSNPVTEIDVDALEKTVASVVQKIRDKVVDSAIREETVSDLNNRILDLEFQMNTTINGPTFEQIMIDANKTQDMLYGVFTAAKAISIPDNERCELGADVGICMPKNSGSCRTVITDSFSCQEQSACCSGL